MICLHCGEKLYIFADKNGYRHRDGSLYKQRFMSLEEWKRFVSIHKRNPKPSEQMVDDHCAQAIQET
jgi:hypothetical protein